MKHTDAKTPVTQLPMPGMPAPPTPEVKASLRNVSPGREVLYLGNVTGGPRYGTRGVVKQTLGRRVVVDLGRWGTWHIPYYFLSVLSEAA